MKISKSEFVRNWHLGAGYDEEIDYSTPNTEVPFDDRLVFEAADTNKDGRLALEEAWAYLKSHIDGKGSVEDKKAKIRDEELACRFAAALESLFEYRRGRDAPMVMSAPVRALARNNIDGEVLYLQFNRPAGKPTSEEKDVEHYVGKDPDQPALKRLDLTEQFNSWSGVFDGNVSFKETVLGYLKSRPADSWLTGFVFSAHSNGDQLLQEAKDEHGSHYYRAKLQIRSALCELRDDPDPEVRRLVRSYFDRVEYVVALGCFEGNATGEWSRIFPNATIVGTATFAPASSREDSGKMVRAAITAATHVEYGGTAEEAIRLGLNDATALLRNDRGLRIDPPQRRRERAERGAKQAETIYLGRPDDPDSPRARAVDLVNRFDAKAGDMTAMAAELARELKAEKFQAADLKKLYSIVNAHYISSRSLWALNQPEGSDMELPEELAELEWQRNVLFLVRKALEH